MYDCEKDYEALSPAMKEAVQRFIAITIQPAQTEYAKRTSYGLKHSFEHSSPNNCPYLTNEEFKGAMVAAGYVPVNEKELNWTFKIKPLSPYRRHSSKHKKGYGEVWDVFCVCHLSDEELTRYVLLVSMACE